ncbi:hypothetical protein QBC32DRAFT_344243 [Pseudoneurospora amorphoporcata]|uniref:Uncharacterized protein n=1 Tax=Pseudoneurospora amorphoporcata TaxID=241081 RepID=A0AAN6SF54_9PEZI|nr:hypothetical protein QBC32DRAFT_344243 [Pseudoneurospora amorphoporcata]
MLTTQALPVMLGWLGIQDMLGVLAHAGASVGKVADAPRFNHTLRSVTINTNVTSLTDSDPYDVSVPSGFRILELFHTEVPKNRDDPEEGSYLGTVV